MREQLNIISIICRLEYKYLFITAFQPTFPYLLYWTVSTGIYWQDYIFDYLIEKVLTLW